MAELKDVIATLDNAADSFESIANKEQKKIYGEVITLAKDLDLDASGKVKQSIANLKRLTQIKAKLAALSKDKEWVAGISGFATYFGVLQKQQNEYFSEHFPEHTLSTTAKEKNNLMRKMAIQNTMEALMGDGLKANVTDKLNDILLRAVTTGAKFGDLQEELRAHLLGKDGGQGAFARYATTYATTALSQYTGQQNKLLSEGLDTDWYMYTGSNKETTREFCEQLTKKKFIHKSEIPTILTGKIDDYQCAIYPKTGLPYGMIEGTTVENFQCNCGGWNCRHQLVPVADAVVPASLRAKFKQVKPTVNNTQYGDQISSIERYIAEHPKSEKIKRYLAAINDAISESRNEDLISLIKAAKADIAKFIAAANAHKKGKAAKADEPVQTNSPTLKPIVNLKNEYKSTGDVRGTVRSVDSQKKWFNPNNKSNGVGLLLIETNPGNNGSTNRETGTIYLTKDRANGVVRAFDKIAKGNPEDITIDEADAMATYLHEITHNKHHNVDSAGGQDSITRRYMETANEYIARETMDEFYEALGVTTPKNAIPFKKTRKSTGYQRDVAKIQYLIGEFQCDKSKMNSVLQDKLFNGKYKDLKNGIADALYQSGGCNLVYSDNEESKGAQFTKEDILKILEWAIEADLPIDSIKRNIKNSYPNLRNKNKKD